MKSSIRRIALIITAGIGIALLGDWVTRHPYFDIIFWTETTIWQHREDCNHSILLQAACSPVLPRHIRLEAFKAAMYVNDFCDTNVSLPNNQIAHLMDYFSEENFSMDDYISLYEPFLEEGINPQLINVVLNQSLIDYNRLVAFDRVMYAKPMTKQRADEVFHLWMLIDSANIQEQIYEFITTPPRCVSAKHPSNLVERFRQQ